MKPSQKETILFQPWHVLETMLGFGRRATVVTLQFSHGTCKWKTISSSRKKVLSSHCHFSLPLWNLWCFYCSYSYWDSLHSTEIAACTMEKQWRGSKTSPKDLSRLGPVGSFVFLWVSSFEWVALEPLFDISYMIPGTCCLSSILGRNNPPKHCLFAGVISGFQVDGGEGTNGIAVAFCFDQVCVCVVSSVFPTTLSSGFPELKLPSRHLDSLLLCDGIISHTEIFHGLGSKNHVEAASFRKIPYS